MAGAIGLAILVCVAYGFAITRPTVTRSGALVLWFVASVICGLCLPSNPLPSVGAMVGVTILLAFALLIAMILFALQAKALRWLSDRKDDDDWGPVYGQSIEFIAKEDIAKLVVVIAIHFLGSSIVIPAAWVAKEQILGGLDKVYEFGPDGINRINNMVVAVSVLLASLGALGLWVFSRGKQPITKQTEKPASQSSDTSPK